MSNLLPVLFNSSSLSTTKQLHTGEGHQSPLPSLLRLLKSARDLGNLSCSPDDDARLQRYQLARAKLQNATIYDDWLRAAAELDELEGNDEWKEDPISDDYNYTELQMRLAQLKEAQLSCDVGRMLFLIRTSFARNTGDMGNINLYRRSYTGTKKLIEEYLDACLTTIDRLLSTPRSAMTPSNRQILESLLQTRQAYGRTALLLSGGATFGMMHVGVLKVLFEENLLPRIISGASAGSIVASVLCTKTETEIPEVLERFAEGDLAVFEDEENPENLLCRVARFLKIGAWIDVKHLVRVMKALLGDLTFQEAYYRTRRVLNICVSPASTYELPRLLNYITSPNVIIWSAVAASCSVPFLFTPSSLLAKGPLTGEPIPWNPSRQLWIDGSVDNDLPMARLSEMFNVNHFIVSQVNPHVAPFIPHDEHPTANSSSSARSWGATLVNLATAEIMHRMSVLATLGLFRTPLTKAKCVLAQKYTGDITILPKLPSYFEFHRMIKNPTPEFMLSAGLRGERATWPKISRIRNHCAVELAIDRAVHMLRTRVVFSPSQADLRLLVTLSPSPNPNSSSSNRQRRRVKSSDGTCFRTLYHHHRRSRSNSKDGVAPPPLPLPISLPSPPQTSSPFVFVDDSECSTPEKPPWTIAMPPQSPCAVGLLMTPSTPPSPPARSEVDTEEGKEQVGVSGEVLGGYWDYAKKRTKSIDMGFVGMGVGVGWA